jgi:hypothetical protein
MVECIFIFVTCPDLASSWQTKQNLLKSPLDGSSDILENVFQMSIKQKKVPSRKKVLTYRSI